MVSYYYCYPILFKCTCSLTGLNDFTRLGREIASVQAHTSILAHILLPSDTISAYA